MSTLPSKSELFYIFDICCNHVIGIEKLSLERISQLDDYLKNLQKQENDNAFTFIVADIVKQYRSYLKGDELHEFQKLQRLTHEERLRKIDKDISNIMKVFHHPQFGNKYKEFEQ